jgi:hypothetical protein
MRPSPWIGLVTVALLGAAGLLQAADKPGKAPPVPPDIETWEVTGYGQSVRDAERDAAEKARVLVEDFLLTKHPDLGWAPSAAYLRQSNVVSTLGKPVETEFEHAGKVWMVKMRVEIGPSQMKDMQVLARQQRQQIRHRLAGWVLLGVILLLAVGIGYLRLEDATRGHLTGTLRVSALALASLIVAGIWWLAQT